MNVFPLEVTLRRQRVQDFPQRVATKPLFVILD
jgi:hypothetical protein